MLINIIIIIILLLILLVYDTIILYSIPTTLRPLTFGILYNTKDVFNMSLNKMSIVFDNNLY